MARPIERVEVDSPDGVLPGYLIPSCMDGPAPGTGEPLRLRGVPSRPDYKVPTAAIGDYLQTRPAVDPGRIGLLGISLGGYYAPRGAALEHRVTACAAWCGVWD